MIYNCSGSISKVVSYLTWILIIISGYLHKWVGWGC